MNGSYVESADVPGAMDAPEVQYAMAREGRVPHIYVGPVSVSGFIGRLSFCERVIVTRLAHPSDTASGRVCRWCLREEGTLP